jgi:3-dehydroquinate dehydratase/shikimate dehydrogenase
MIFTLRNKSQGGFYLHNETQRLQDITSLCEISPDFLDLEYDISKEFLQKIHEVFPKIKLICSYHNFNETPQNLPSLLGDMQNPCFQIYKIATQANSITDSKRMLQFVKETHQTIPLIGICMGEHGKVTRILGPKAGNILNYACVSDELATAPGQISLKELVNIYP